MSHSTALWEAISGTPWPYDEKKADEWVDTHEKFMNVFGGIKPGQGTINVSKTTNPIAVASYYKSKGYNVVGIPKEEAAKEKAVRSTPVSLGGTDGKPVMPKPKANNMASDIDELLMKAHGLHPMNLAPNANKWALNLFHQQLASLPENQRRYLADPNISDAEKIVRLQEWTGFKTLNDVHEYSRRLKEEEGVGAAAFGGWSGYQSFLNQVEQNNPAHLRIRAWTPQWKENLRKYGLDDRIADPILYDWYYFNQIWKHNPDDPRTEAYKYKQFQGDFEGFYKQRAKDLMAQGKIGQNFNLQKYISGEKVISPSEKKYPSSFYGIRPASSGGGKTGSTSNIPVSPQSFQGTMTDILNLLQLADTYKPLDESIQKLMNPEVAIQPYKEQIGTLLNQMSRRGVINSTLLERELNRITQSWLDRARELQERGILGAEELRRAAAAQGLTARNLAATLALNKYRTDIDTWLRNKGIDLDEAYRRNVLGERIREALFNEAFDTARWTAEWNRQKWLDQMGALKTLLGIEEGDWTRSVGAYGSLNNILNQNRRQFLSDMITIWGRMFSGRYGTPSETRTVSGGVSPFLSFLAPVIGDIGKEMGGSIMDSVLGAIKGIFTPEGMGKAAASAAMSFIAPGGTELLVPGFPGV